MLNLLKIENQSHWGSRFQAAMDPTARCLVQMPSLSAILRAVTLQPTDQGSDMELQRKQKA